jgi:phosphocarrier protein HPr
MATASSGAEGGDEAPDPAPAGPPPASAAVQTRSVQIVNRRGLHARAAAKFVKEAERFSACVNVRKNGSLVSARSIMGLMMLGAGPGATLSLEAEGWDAREALEALSALVEAGFHEQD